MRLVRSLTLLIFGFVMLTTTWANAANYHSPKSIVVTSCEDIFVSDVWAPGVWPTERGPQNREYHLEASDAAFLYDRILQKLSQASLNRYARGDAFDSRPVLSIVIPAYREEKRIPRSIEILRAFMERYPLSYEVIVVAERSPDNTFFAAKQAAEGAEQIQVVANRDGRDMPLQGGKGFAVRTGMYRATGQYKLFMDADLSTSLIEILRFLDTMIDDGTAPKPQMLIGSRIEHEADSDQHRTLIRRLMSSTMHGLTSMLGRPPEIVDTQCGFKMFTDRAARTLFVLQTEKGFAFDVELILLAGKFGFDLQSQPVEWIDAPGSTVHPIRDSLKMLKAMFRIHSVTQDTDRDIRREKAPKNEGGK